LRYVIVPELSERADREKLEWRGNCSARGYDAAVWRRWARALPGGPRGRRAIGSGKQPGTVRNDKRAAGRRPAADLRLTRSLTDRPASGHARSWRPSLCAVEGRVFRPRASLCSAGGSPRPEPHTLTAISGQHVVRGDGEVSWCLSSDAEDGEDAVFHPQIPLSAALGQSVETQDHPRCPDHLVAGELLVELSLLAATSPTSSFAYHAEAGLAGPSRHAES